MSYGILNKQFIVKIKINKIICLLKACLLSLQPIQQSITQS